MGIKNLWHFPHVILKENIIKKNQKYKSYIKWDKDNGEKYDIDIIYNSNTYVEKLNSDHLLDLYHLFLGKDNLKEKNIQDPTFIIF